MYHARAQAPTSNPSLPPSLWTSRRLTVWGAGLLCLSWFIYIHTMTAPGLVDRDGRFKGTDHIYFYVMGSLMLDGRTGDLYNPEAHLAEGQRRMEKDVPKHDPMGRRSEQITPLSLPVLQ